MAQRSPLEDNLDIVGNLPDREVGKRVGVTAENVRSWRGRRRIPARWRGETDEDVQVRPETKKRARKSAERRSSKLDAFEHLLGIAADETIARFARLRTSSVAVYRRRKGIPAPSRSEKKLARYRKSKLDLHLHLLGQGPDAKIAKLAGVSTENVRAFRARHGIPSSKEVLLVNSRRGREAAQERVAAARTVKAPSVPGDGPNTPVASEEPGQAEASPLVHTQQQWAFRIVVTSEGADREYIVIASDLAQAAAVALERLAAADARASLDSIRRLTEVL